jgi:tryptophan synthase alpha chain
VPNPIQQAFQRAENDGRTAILPFVTVGHPQRDSTPAVVEALSEAGADAIELGIPFSDPLAEGPVIQKSSFQALQNGITPAVCFENATEIRRRGVNTPLIFMGYYNPILQIGLDEFCKRTRDAGVDGIIVADLPAREAGPLIDACANTDISLVPLLALTSTDQTIARACKQASGFVYCVSSLGVTGVRAEVSQKVEALVKRVRIYTDLPVAVGFGIANSQHVQAVGRYADGAVIGSALVNLMQDNAIAPETAASFLRSVRD